MEITSASAILQAQSAYQITNNRPITPSQVSEATINMTASFQAMVDANLNRFAKMSAEQIIANVAASKESFTKNNVSLDAFMQVAQLIKRDEIVKQQALEGKASMAAVLQATTEASAALQLAVTVKDKLTSAAEKVLNMQI